MQIVPRYGLYLIVSISYCLQFLSSAIGFRFWVELVLVLTPSINFDYLDRIQPKGKLPEKEFFFVLCYTSYSSVLFSVILRSLNDYGNFEM